MISMAVWLGLHLLRAPEFSRELEIMEEQAIRSIQMQDTTENTRVTTTRSLISRWMQLLCMVLRTHTNKVIVRA